MNNTIHTETVGTFTIRVYLDSDAESPFAEDLDGVALHLSFGREGNLITPNAKRLTREDIQEWLSAKPRRVTNPADDFHNWKLFPVYAYIHGGVTCRLGSFDGLLPQGHAEFDSGLCGILLLEGATVEGDQKRATGLIQAVNDWMGGEVYGYEVENADGDIVDSCWGFHGDYETSGMLDQVRRACKTYTAATK